MNYIRRSLGVMVQSTPNARHVVRRGVTYSRTSSSPIYVDTEWWACALITSEGRIRWQGFGDLPGGIITNSPWEAV